MEHYVLFLFHYESCLNAENSKETPTITKDLISNYFGSKKVEGRAEQVIK